MTTNRSEGERLKTRESDEDFFRFLPLTKAEIEKVPLAIHQMFRAHREFVKNDHRYLKGGGKRTMTDGARYDVQIREMGEEAVSSFYCESEDACERTTIELTTNKSYNRVRKVKVTLDKFDKENRILSIDTTINLRKGVYIEQQITPIPVSVKPSIGGQQIFIFKTNESPLATLKWRLSGKELEIITVTPTEEIISLEILNGGKITTNFETGERSFETPNGVLSLPPPDKHLSEAIKSVSLLKPFVFLTNSRMKIF